MKKILISGINGFLGKHLNILLRKYLPETQIDGLVKDCCNIINEEDVKLYLNTIKPDIIIHLAANPNGNAGPSVIQDNIQGTLNLVHNAPEGCHFIFASSVVVYGEFQFYNFLEDHTPAPTSLYGLSKLCAENVINRYARLNKIKKTNLRFSALVGNHLTHGFVYDVLNKIKSKTDSLELFGKFPGSIKPFLHVIDACNAIIHCIKNEIIGTYNICPNDNISVDDVTNIILKHFNMKKEIVWKESKVWEGDNQEIKCGNCKFFNTGFNFEYKTSSEAIKAMLNEHTT